jgi:hypothetical protein
MEGKAPTTPRLFNRQTAKKLTFSAGNLLHADRLWSRLSSLLIHPQQPQ